MFRCCRDHFFRYLRRLLMPLSSALLLLMLSSPPPPRFFLICFRRFSDALYSRCSSFFFAISPPCRYAGTAPSRFQCRGYDEKDGDIFLCYAMPSSLRRRHADIRHFFELFTRYALRFLTLLMIAAFRFFAPSRLPPQRHANNSGFASSAATDFLMVSPF